MCNGILHVNTKVNIIVMMKIENNTFCQWLRKYVQKMSQKPYSVFEGKNGTAKLKRPFYPSDLVPLAENGRSVRVW